MIAKWLRKRERKRITEQCPHDWRLVREYREQSFHGFYVDYYDAITLFCPICETERDGVCAVKGAKELKIQEIRRQYEERGE